jgi:hypothetical protein
MGVFDVPIKDDIVVKGVLGAIPEMLLLPPDPIMKFLALPPPIAGLVI